MDRQLLNKVCNEIYHRFPEISGSEPKVQSRPDDQTLLIFNGSAKAADGHKIARTVRVVVNQTGRIIKVTSSR